MAPRTIVQAKVSAKGWIVIPAAFPVQFEEATLDRVLGAARVKAHPYSPSSILSCCPLVRYAWPGD